MRFILQKNAPAEWSRSLSATREAERVFLRAVQEYLGGADVTDEELTAAIQQGPEAVAKLLAGPDADAELLAAYTQAAQSITALAETGANTALGLSLSFNLTNPYSAPWIAAHGAELVQGVGDLTRAAIRQIVSDSFTDEYTVAETARKIRAWVGLLPRQITAANNYAAMLGEGAKADRALARYVSQLRQQRAVNIARTETINAHAQGTLDAWRTARDHGLIRPGAQKVWIAATASDRTCPICADLDGQTAPLDGTFPGGYFAPTAHPSCRCALALTWKKA
jgi:SPP1 gp7 family putative phage head morphogenesis protein